MLRRLSSLIASPLDPVVERRALVCILVLAAVLRLALQPVIAARLGFLPDVVSYRKAAAEILLFTPLSDPWLMPGYPILVALSGGGGFGQLLADIAVSVVGVWCVARIAQILAGDALAGLFAALVWTVYPFAIFYTVVGLTENLFVTLFLLGFLGYLQGRFAWGSLAMVAAILTRPTTEILTPILIVAFALVVHRLSLRQTLRHLGVFAAIYVALMAPWWWHNYLRYGEFVRLDLAAGRVLYAGNNPANTDGGGVDMKVKVPAYHAVKDPVIRDRILRQAAWQYIVGHPRRFIELAVLKFERLWRPWPYAQDYSGLFLAVVSAAAYLPVLVLAIAGAIAMVRRRDVKLLPIILFIGFLTAVHMITIGSLRYRFPMEPFLVILAGLPLSWIARRVFGAPAAGHAVRGTQ